MARDKSNINPDWDKDELEDYTRQLEDFVRDLSTHGLKVDMQPTLGAAQMNEIQMYGFMSNYFKNAESTLRHRAEEALQAKK